jgi:hypothetical protein
MAKKFSAQVDDWIAKSERLSMAVLQQATQAVINEANTPVAKGGRMRVDTGFLRNSLKASIGSMPSGASAPGNWDDSEVVLTLTRLQPGQVFYAGWTANYARPREHFDGFLRMATQKWQQQVDAAARQLKQRAGR